MKKVQQLLESKGRGVVTVGPGSTVLEALELMARTEVGALVVVEGEEIRGLLSERDYARKVILKGKRSPDTPVKDIMTPEVFTVRPDQSVELCMSIMTAKRIRHLPVIDDGRLAGIISIGDVVKAIIEEQQGTIEQLEEYISGRG